MNIPSYGSARFRGISKRTQEPQEPMQRAWQPTSPWSLSAEPWSPSVKPPPPTVPKRQRDDMLTLISGGEPTTSMMMRACLPNAYSDGKLPKRSGASAATDRSLPTSASSARRCSRGWSASSARRCSRGWPDIQRRASAPDHRAWSYRPPSCFGEGVTATTLDLVALGTDTDTVAATFGSVALGAGTGWVTG